MTKTMTERDFLTMVLANCDNNTIKEYASSRLEKLDNKNKQRRATLTKTQKENESLKAKILEMLKENSNVTFIANEVATKFEISTQKASALCKQLADSEQIVASEVKITGKGKVKGYAFKA